MALPSFAKNCLSLFTEKTTNEYYNSHAQEYSETRSHVSDELEVQRQHFLNNLPKNADILEIGAGHGRDALYFKEQGLKVLATEPSVELAKIAESKIHEPVLNLTAQEITFKNEFDGIWAMASLIHVPMEELPLAFLKMRDSLKENGIIHASFLKGVGTPDVPETLPDGRYFNRVSEKKLREIVSKIDGLEIVEGLTKTQKDDYFGKNAPTSHFGFFNLFLRKTNAKK